MKMEEFMEEGIKLSQDDEQRRRSKKRSDLVSKKLGELLLQGYKMLNSTCEKCDCILMQKKNEPYYCVGCQDSEIKSFDIEMNSTLTTSKEKQIVSENLNNLPSNFQKKIENKVNHQNENENETVNVIKDKINWATQQLKNSNILRYDIELLDYIKKCSETISAMNNVIN